MVWTKPKSQKFQEKRASVLACELAQRGALGAGREKEGELATMSAYH